MYYVVYGILWIVSLLPLSILYLFSDLFYALAYHVFKYRREIVFNNLAHAFPEKSKAEREKIARQFYKNFTDALIESVKLISSGKKFIASRSKGEFETLNKLTDKGYSINAMAGHQFNWEFANLLYAQHLKSTFVGIYMPISNKALDKVFYNLRERYGTVLISAQDFKNKMHAVFREQFVLGLAADQNPGDPSNAYWMEFMGRPAPFVTGPAKGAVKNNVAVVFVAMVKTKRGHYRFEPSLLTEHAANHTEEELTLLYKNKLEETIRKDPSNYLWSHRRWKYNWKAEYGPIHK